MTLYNALCARLRAFRTFLVSQYHLTRERAVLSYQMALADFMAFLERLACSSYLGYLAVVAFVFVLTCLLSAVAAVVGALAAVADAVASGIEVLVECAGRLGRSDWRAFKEAHGR